jgi:hypothetical protein
LLAGSESIHVRQAFVFFTALTAISCAIAALRIRTAPSASEYKWLFWLLNAWAITSVSTLVIPLSSRLYFLVFLLIVPISWVLYFLVARDLYQRVFRDYRGIAFAGRTCLWAAAVLTPAGVTLSLVFSPGGLTESISFATIVLLDRCVLFCIALFLVLLVSVMIRYPIPVGKNLAVHSIFLSSILFSQVVVQIVDQWTLYQHTAYMNSIAAAFDALLTGAWALFLSRSGDSVMIRFRGTLESATEHHLLGQLDALNGILLRAARK